MSTFNQQALLDELSRVTVEQAHKLQQSRRIIARIEALAESFAESGVAEWSGTEIAHMIHANLEGETK